MISILILSSYPFCILRSIMSSIYLEDFTQNSVVDISQLSFTWNNVCDISLFVVKYTPNGVIGIDTPRALH